MFHYLLPTNFFLCISSLQCLTQLVELPLLMCWRICTTRRGQCLRSRWKNKLMMNIAGPPLHVTTHESVFSRVYTENVEGLGYGLGQNLQTPSAPARIQVIFIWFLMLIYLLSTNFFSCRLLDNSIMRQSRFTVYRLNPVSQAILIYDIVTLALTHHKYPIFRHLWDSGETTLDRRDFHEQMLLLFPWTCWSQRRWFFHGHGCIFFLCFTPVSIRAHNQVCKFFISSRRTWSHIFGWSSDLLELDPMRTKSAAQLKQLIRADEEVYVQLLCQHATDSKEGNVYCSEVILSCALIFRIVFCQRWGESLAPTAHSLNWCNWLHVSTSSWRLVCQEVKRRLRPGLAGPRHPRQGTIEGGETNVLSNVARQKVLYCSLQLCRYT